MLAAWWTADGEDARVAPDYSGASVDIYPSNHQWDLCTIVEIDSAYQRDYHYGSSHPLEMGYFYLYNTSNTYETVAADTSCIESGQIYPAPQHEGEIKQLHKGQTNVWRWPFMHDTSYGNYSITAYFPASPAGETGEWTFHLKHFQPYAYYGFVGEVIPSILMELGIDQDYIDTDAFDDSYDDQQGAIYNSPVGYAREVGVSVFESLQEISTHAKEMFGLTMGGKVTMPPRATPSETTTALAGIKELTWRYATEHQYNDVRVTGGMASLATLVNRVNAPTEMDGNDEVDNDSYYFATEWDSAMAGALGDSWEYSVTESLFYSDAPRLRLAGTETTYDGKRVERQLPTHMRFYNSPALGGQYQTERMDLFTLPLREVTVVQDYRGLDYDVGHRVYDVVTDAGDIPGMLCISKEIDDDNHTVTSVLLEDKSYEGEARSGSAFSSAFSSAFGA
jgi:hypothetical protein